LLRALASSPPSRRAALAVLLPLAVPLPLAVLPRLPRRRRRRRVCLPALAVPRTALTRCAEKEESDEDMGFGLFD
jgi:hypothetical protein